MAKLYWVKMEVQPTGTAFDDGSDTTIEGILTEGLELVENEETSTIEDNQDVNIAYEGGFTAETRNTTCTDGTTNVLDLTVNDPTAKADVRLTAQEGTTYTLNEIYMNARKGILSSNELGVKMNGKRTDSTDPVTYA